MKSRFVACFVVLAFLGLTSAARNLEQAGKKEGGERANVEKEIMDMEQKLRDANLKNDVSYIEQALAEDFVGVGSEGNVYGKAGGIRVRKSGKLKFESIEQSGQKVRVYGNTAIVTGTSNVNLSFMARHHPGTYRYTRVYVRMGESWKVVNFQVTKVQPPES